MDFSKVAKDDDNLVSLSCSFHNLLHDTKMLFGLCLFLAEVSASLFSRAKNAMNAL